MPEVECGGMPPEVCEKLLVEASLIKVRLDVRKFGKPVTIIDGLPNDKETLKHLARFFKTRLAAGGTFREEEGRVEIQGDHRQKVKQLLVEELGIPEENIIMMS